MNNIYLTSKNSVKCDVVNMLFTKYKQKLKINSIICIESDSEIKGGQPYSINETQQGCINRVKQFKNDENFISIENGFVKESKYIWYDIAFIYIRINNKQYSGWSAKRHFPSDLYNDIAALINYFKYYSITRHTQIYNCLEDIIVNKINT